MAAGLGFKTFTTGEVLTAADTNGYLMQGINVFASTAARDAAITSPQEGQFAFTKDTNGLWYYDGAAWVASGATGDIEGVTAGIGISGGGTSGTVTVTNSMATAIDAKGDLVPGTGADTFSRLAVGANDTVLTADSAQATGLKWATPSAGSTNVAGKNNILNSAFNVAQRGTSFTIAASTATYTLDRWQAYRTATGMTVTQQNTSDTTNLPFIQKCVRLARDNATTSTVAIQYVQTIETVNSIPYAGKAITLSFYARAGANYSPTSSALLVYLQTGTGTDQNYINGFTGASNIVNGSTATLTTTWQRFTFNATVGATATQLAVALNMNPTGTAGAADYCEVTGFQLEIASSASAYSPNTSTYEAELAACQRYYSRVQAVTTGEYFGMGPANNPSGGLMYVTYPVRMRVAPTSLDYSLLFLQQYDSGGNYRTANVTSISFSNVGTQSANCNSTTASSSFSATGEGMQLLSQAGLGYLGFNAEL